MTIAEIRQRYPQYSDLSDGQLVSALHKKYYADMPVQEFHQKVGYSEAQSPYEPIGTTLAMAVPRALQRGGAAVQESLTGGAEQIASGREELLGNRPLSGMADLAMGGLKVVASPFIGAFETANGLMHGTPLQPMAEAVNAPSVVYEHYVPHSQDPGLEKLRELGGFAAGALPFVVGEGLLAARKPMPSRLPADFNIAETPQRVMALPEAPPQLALPPSTRFEVYPGGTAVDRFSPTPTSPVDPMLLASPLPTEAPANPLALPSATRFTAYPGGTIRDAFSLPPVAEQAPMLPMERPVPPQMPKMLPAPIRFMATPGGRIVDITYLSEGEVAALQQASAFTGRPVERMTQEQTVVPPELPKTIPGEVPSTAVQSPNHPVVGKFRFPLPEQAGGGWFATDDWRAAYEKIPNPELKNDLLRAVANNRGRTATAADLSDALEAGKHLFNTNGEQAVGNLSNLANDIAQNPAATPEVKLAAKQFYEDITKPAVESPKADTKSPSMLPSKSKGGEGAANMPRPAGKPRSLSVSDMTYMVGHNSMESILFYFGDHTGSDVRLHSSGERIIVANPEALRATGNSTSGATGGAAKAFKQWLASDASLDTLIDEETSRDIAKLRKEMGIEQSAPQETAPKQDELKPAVNSPSGPAQPPAEPSPPPVAKPAGEVGYKGASGVDSPKQVAKYKIVETGKKMPASFKNPEKMLSEYKVSVGSKTTTIYADSIADAQVQAQIFADGLKASPKRSRLASEAGSAINPAEVILDAAEAIKRLGKKASDFVTINPVPGLRTAGSEAAAREHYSARIAAPYIVKDLWSKVLPESYDNPAAIARVTDLANKNNLLGLYDQLRAEVRQARVDGDKAAFEKAREALSGFESVHLQDIPQWERELQAARQDPAMTEAGKRWNQTVVPLMDRLYNEAKAVDPETLREARGRYPELPGRINLLPKWREAELGQWADPQKPMPEGQTANFKNPDVRRDAFMRKAAGTAVGYSTDGELVLLNALGRRWNEVTKLRLYNDLVDKGAAMWADEAQGKPDGYSSLPVQVPETDPATGRTRQVSRNLLVKNDVIGEVRDVLDTDQRAPNHPIAKALNEVQLTMSLADATAHTKNMLSVLSNTLGRDAVWKDLLTRLPGVSTADALADIVKYSRMLSEDAPATRAKLAVMAKNGMIRPEFPQTPAGKIINPAQRLIHLMDTSSRMALYDRYDSLIEHYGADPSMTARRDFVQQMGEYNRRAMGPAQKWLKDFGASPFIVAGRTFNRYGKRVVTGDPGFKSETSAGALKARAVQLGTVASVIALPAIVNYLRTGNAFGRPGTPLGAVDTGDTDEKGHPIVLDVMQLSGVRRGLRAYGIEPFVEAAAGRREGQTFNDMIGEGMQSAIQTASHPWMGPAPGFAYSTLTGHRLDLRGGPSLEQARATEGKGTDYLERAKFAAQAQNPQLYSLYQVTTGNSLDGQTAGEALQKGWLKAPMSAAGIRSVQSPAERALSEALSKAWSGKSMTEEQAVKARLRSDLINQARQSGGRLPASLPTQYGDVFGRTQFRNMARDAGESWFDAGFRKLDDVPAALKVYEMRKHDDLSPKQAEQLRMMMAVKVARSSLPIGEKQAIFREHPEIAPRPASWYGQN